MRLFTRGSTRQLHDIARVLARHAWREALGVKPSGAFEEALESARRRAVEVLRDIRREGGQDRAVRAVRKSKRTVSRLLKGVVTDVTHSTPMSRQREWERLQPFIVEIEQTLDDALREASASDA